MTNTRYNLQYLPQVKTVITTLLLQFLTLLKTPEMSVIFSLPNHQHRQYIDRRHKDPSHDKDHIVHMAFHVFQIIIREHSRQHAGLVEHQHRGYDRFQQEEQKAHPQSQSPAFKGKTQEPKDRCIDTHQQEFKEQFGDEHPHIRFSQPKVKRQPYDIEGRLKQQKSCHRIFYFYVSPEE